ncbi:MAG: hypothetical protein IH955_08340 [Chloroflexi bacterium]|nr:hypothetical protein [Chloroflexota bacterium]
MPPIAGIRLERSGRMLYFDDAGLNIDVDDYVVVEKDGEEKVGRVVIAPNQLLINQLREPVPSLRRIATTEDLEKSDASHPRP